MKRAAGTLGVVNELGTLSVIGDTGTLGTYSNIGTLSIVGDVGTLDMALWLPAVQSEECVREVIGVWFGCGS